MPASTAVEKLLRRDRWIVLIGLTAVLSIAAAYTLAGVGMSMSAIEMTRMSDMMSESMMAPKAWDAHHFGLMLVMWWVMMIAMMIPAASPTILLYAALQRRADMRTGVAWKAAMFLFGYLVAWLSFSLIATYAQWLLELASLASAHTMTVTSERLAVAILLAAGLYQFTPLKRACLRHCREPIRFLTENRRSGKCGAFTMGAHHGLFCLGCCWFLMLLLFFGGVMNLYWIGGLAIFVFVEKVVPQGHWLGYVVGAGLLMASAGLFFSSY